MRKCVRALRAKPNIAATSRKVAEYAVDLVLVRDSSPRTVTSGSARQSAPIRSTTSSGISTGSLTRRTARSVPGVRVATPRNGSLS